MFGSVIAHLGAPSFRTTAPPAERQIAVEENVDVREHEVVNA